MKNLIRMRLFIAQQRQENSSFDFIETKFHMLTLTSKQGEDILRISGEKFI